MRQTGPTNPLATDRVGVRDWLVVTVTFLAGVFVTAVGISALLRPNDFADFADFPVHEHFLHDIGAFQIGIGAGLLLALIWQDALAVALAAFLLGNTIHAVNHAADLELGGHDSDSWALGALSVLVLVALVRRLRRLEYVVGYVGATTDPQLAPFLRQKTALLTSYRRDGTPVATPLSVAVDGERAVIRSFEKAWKTKRMRHNSTVELAPCSMRGKPAGPAARFHSRRIDRAESRDAARLLHAKHPLLQGVLMPLGHRVLARHKTGPTVHFELTPLAPDGTR